MEIDEQIKIQTLYSKDGMREMKWKINNIEEMEEELMILEDDFNTRIGTKGVYVSKKEENFRVAIKRQSD